MRERCYDHNRCCCNELIAIMKVKWIISSNELFLIEFFNDDTLRHKLNLFCVLEYEFFRLIQIIPRTWKCWKRKGTTTRAKHLSSLPFMWLPNSIAFHRFCVLYTSIDAKNKQNSNSSILWHEEERRHPVGGCILRQWLPKSSAISCYTFTVDVYHAKG